MQTPFFFDWQARFSQTRKKCASLRNRPLQELQGLFGDLVPENFLAQDGQRENSRRRSYTIEVTFWAFLWQVVNAGSSCRRVVRQLQAFFQFYHNESIDEQDGAYCQARRRLPMAKLQSIFRRVATSAEQRASSQPRWKGRAVKFLDGTTVSLADSPKNQKSYPQPSNQKEGCGFPVIKLVGLFSLASGALIDYVTDTLHASELQLFRKLMDWFQAGEIMLSDRHFSDYATLAMLLDRGADAVCRLHQARRSDFRQGRGIGSNDRLVTWKKPRHRVKTLTPEQWRNLPEELTLRMVKFQIHQKGFRPKQVILITTLLDPEEYPLEDLAELYLRRWRIELHLRDIKTTMGMEVLRCKSPELVHKELQMHLIAYNLIRCLMIQAAAIHEVNLDRLSFKGSLDSVCHFGPKLSQATTKKKKTALINQLLETMAKDLVPDRPNRREPRAQKRRPKPYQFLTQHRRNMKETPHRGRKTKSA